MSCLMKSPCEYLLYFFSLSLEDTTSGLPLLHFLVLVSIKMSSRCWFLTIPVHPCSKGRKIRVLFDQFRCFCNMLELPELPDWVKQPQGKRSPLTDSDEDFVLRTNLESLENKAVTRKADDSGAYARMVAHEVMDDGADRICDILKEKFVSPEAVVRAIGNCSVEVSQGLVDRMLKRFSNDWILAFGFFKWAGAQVGYQHLSVSYDMMVDILGKSKKFDVMWGLIEEMVELEELVSLETMTKVMRRLAGAGRWGDAIKVFHDIEYFRIKKDTVAMNVLLDTLCKERSVKHARDVFVELRRGIPPNASSFNALIHGWCQARKLEEARYTLEEMREFGFNPCVISYTNLIEAYCADKNFQMVDATLDEMHNQGCPPNIVTYTIIMNSLGKAKETEEALKIFDMMKRDCCAPDTSFYNSLIYILGSVGRLQDATNILEEMCKNGFLPNVTTYNTLISALCDHSQHENALRLLVKMEESSCKPDIKTYTPLLKLCCKRKWMKILFYLLAHMFKRDVSLDLGTYTLLVHGLCRNGELEKSLIWFEEMVSRGMIPKHHTCKLLLETFERKNMERAKAKVQQWMVHAQSMKKLANTMNKHDI